MGRLFVFNGLILVYFVIFTLPIYLLTRLKLNNVRSSLKKGKSEKNLLNILLNITIFFKTALSDVESLYKKKKKLYSYTYIKHLFLILGILS